MIGNKMKGKWFRGAVFTWGLLIVVNILFLLWFAFAANGCSCEDINTTDQGILASHLRSDEGLYIHHTREVTSWGQKGRPIILVKVVNDAPITQYGELKCVWQRAGTEVWSSSVTLSLRRYRWKNVYVESGVVNSLFRQTASCTLDIIPEPPNHDD